MSTEWEPQLLGQLYEFNSGLSKPRSEFGSGHPFLSFKDVFYNFFVPEALTERVKSTERERRLCSIRRGDVFLTRTSETVDELGMSCIALEDYHEATFNGFTKRLRPKSDRILPEFAGYLFRGPEFRRGITSMSSLSTRASLNNEMLSRVTVRVPPKEVQEAIAGTLKPLDDKVELNRQMSDTLEGIARAIFKSWFVDFDPVRAKMEGRKPFGMDAETAELFPVSFVESQLGPIPDGWKVRKLGDLCGTQYGYTASAVNEPVGPKFLRVKDINKLPWIDWSKVPHCPISESDRVKYGLTKGDVVVARMADPGKAAIVEDDVNAVFASYLVRLKTQSLAWAYFVHGFLKSDLYAEYAEGATTGSVQKNMNARVIVDIQLAVPPTTLVNSFLRLILPLRERLVLNLRESAALAQLRDTLLPKLISGEVRIGDAEQMTEAGA